MKNSKFIIHNHTKDYTDYEVFEFILECLEKGLISNDNTEYCYCIVRECERWDLVFESNKTKTGYRFDIFQVNKNKKKGLELE